MSYDIYFVRRDPGQSFEDALEALEESYEGDPGPLSDVDLEAWEEILPRAREILGEVEVFGDETTRELSHLETGIELSLFSGEVSLTVPYWHADADAVEVMRKVYALARAVEDATGLEGYDVQLEEPVSEALEGDAGQRFAAMAARLRSGASAGRGEPRRTWQFWKR